MGPATGSVGGITVSFPIRLFAFVLVLGAVHAAPDSPFAPSGAYALVGMSATPRQTEVCIRTKADGASRWIAVGAAAGGIQVLSCDPGRNSAVIQAGGRKMILVLRPSEGVGAAAAPDPSAVAKADAAAKARQAVAIREQRMLVSDLLDVGMKQRRPAGNAPAQAPSR